MCWSSQSCEEAWLQQKSHTRGKKKRFNNSFNIALFHLCPQLHQASSLKSERGLHTWILWSDMILFEDADQDYRKILNCCDHGCRCSDGNVWEWLRTKICIYFLLSLLHAHIFQKIRKENTELKEVRNREVVFFLLQCSFVCLYVLTYVSTIGTIGIGLP